MIKVWSLPTRLLHWGLVISFVIAFYTRHSELMRLSHVNAGYVAGAVILARWLYGFLMRDFSSFRRFPPNPGAGMAYLLSLTAGKAKRYLGHNPAGALAIYAMLTLGTFTVVTGYLSYNDIVLPFGLVSEDQVDSLHNLAANAWVLVVVAHLLGVAVGCLYHKENLVLAMITGNKRKRTLRAGSAMHPESELATLSLPESLRLQYIEEAAYYIAERRGFQAGQAWEDWLQAEKQVDELLKSGKLAGANKVA